MFVLLKGLSLPPPLPSPVIKTVVFDLYAATCWRVVLKINEGVNPFPLAPKKPAK